MLTEYQTKKHSGKPALQHADDGYALTYSQMFEHTELLTKVLQYYGVSVQDKVAIFAENHP